MSWEYLDEEIDELFSDVRMDRFCREPEAPQLHEEVDEQEWQNHRLLSTPQGEMGYSPDPTCLCINYSRRRWKNQHKEGTYLHINTYMSPQWSDQDLEDMAHGPLPPPADQATDILQKSPQEIPAENINRDVYPVSNVRVQISMKQKNTNVKGRYENFEIHDVPLNEIYLATLTLLTHFPKQPRKHINYYTRVQLQNKINGKMQGGRNLSVHNATPEEVADILREIFDGSGWLSPRAGAVDVQGSVEKDSGFSKGRLSQSEDGPPKPGNHRASGEGGRGLLYQSSKMAKVRASLLAELEAQAAG